jgi:hypothetical protein
MRGVINAGHRRGAKTLRMGGVNRQIEVFDPFGPKLIAGIGRRRERRGVIAISNGAAKAAAPRRRGFGNGRSRRHLAVILRTSGGCRWLSDQSDRAWRIHLLSFSGY